jgi:hypothetical protein
MTITITKAQLKALDELLHYVIHRSPSWDELKDYGGDPSHIYNSIHVLAQMHGWDVPSLPKLDKAMAAAPGSDPDDTDQ